MHDYLEAYFTKYRRSINIMGIVRDFKPDGGVRNLKAAIEFKFASSRSEVSRAIGGILDDISGYTGSLDWTRFYTVVYQTEAFETEPRIKQELARAGTVTWQGILVTGSGGRRLPNKRSPARRRERLKSAEPSRTSREAEQVVTTRRRRTPPPPVRKSCRPC